MEIAWMLAPLVACLVAITALVWFGLHVLQREVIFVDLALAQVAALGATTAVYLGHAPDAPVGLGLSLLFVCLGAAAFAGFRQFEDLVPQEALIGITYAVTAALGFLLIELSDDPHGAEHIQHLLVGNIVWVQWSEILVAAGFIAIVGIVHAALGSRLLRLSFEPEAARAEGMKIPLWDLVFYLSFGVVVVGLVSIIGVLLVFSYLVIPAVLGRLFGRTILHRLVIGYGVAVVATVVGVAVSYEHSTGPIVVGILGLMLLVGLLVLSVRRAVSSRLRLFQIGGVGALVAGIIWGGLEIAGQNDPHSHVTHAIKDHDHEVHHQDHSAHAHDHEAVATDADPLTQLEAAVGQVRNGEPSGLVVMAQLVQTAPPFIRMEAHNRLTILADEAAVIYDPLADPDTAGSWMRWATQPGTDWLARKNGITIP
jgi:zinc/manganese transport system permease protein